MGRHQLKGEEYGSLERRKLRGGVSALWGGLSSLQYSCLDCYTTTMYVHRPGSIETLRTEEVYNSARYLSTVIGAICITNCRLTRFR